MKRRLSSTPINTDMGGACRTIKADYYKMGFTNFTRSWVGYKDGFTATAVVETYEEDDTHQRG